MTSHLKDLVIKLFNVDRGIGKGECAPDAVWTPGRNNCIRQLRRRHRPCSIYRGKIRLPHPPDRCIGN